MNEEVIGLLKGYCKWCNAQGGQCQLNLDGCAVGEALTKLEEKPEQPLTKWTVFIEHLELDQKQYCLEYDDHRIANITKEQFEDFERLLSKAPEPKCKTCDGVKVIHSGKPGMYNCELGGTDCEAMTKGEMDNPDACKTCGKTVPCPECMPVANEYYNLWERDAYWKHREKAPEQPPAGEFTKKAIKLDKMCVSEIVAKYESSHNAITVLKRKFRGASTRLDRSEASRKDLLTALKCFPKKLDSQTYEQFYNCCMSWVRTHQDVAITKAKEGGKNE